MAARPARAWKHAKPRKTYRALSSLVNRQRSGERPVCEDHLHRLHILTAWHQSAFRRRRSLRDVRPAGRSCGWSPSSPRSSMATSRSMPILASAVARRPHLFVDVRASSRVHPLPALGLHHNFRAETTIQCFVWSANSKRVCASVPAGRTSRVDPLMWRFRSLHHFRGKSECGLLNHATPRSTGC